MWDLFDFLWYQTHLKSQKSQIFLILIFNWVILKYSVKAQKQLCAWNSYHLSSCKFAKIKICMPHKDVCVRVPKRTSTTRIYFISPSTVSVKGQQDCKLTCLRLSQIKLNQKPIYGFMMRIFKEWKNEQENTLRDVKLNILRKYWIYLFVAHLELIFKEINIFLLVSRFSVQASEFTACFVTELWMKKFLFLHFTL